jgi:hypothetical protein
MIKGLAVLGMLVNVFGELLKTCITKNIRSTELNRKKYKREWIIFNKRYSLSH